MIVENNAQPKTKLQGHVLRHSKIKNFFCIACGKWLKVRASITLHVKIHARENNYLCDQCEAKNASSPALRNHTFQCIWKYLMLCLLSVLIVEMN